MHSANGLHSSAIFLTVPPFIPGNAQPLKDYHGPPDWSVSRGREPEGRLR
jgi:hypothetical protein